MYICKYRLSASTGTQQYSSNNYTYIIVQEVQGTMYIVYIDVLYVQYSYIHT